MPWQTAPAGSAGGRFIEWCRVFGTTPLTCTIFDPVHFGSILRNYVSHISPTRLKLSIMGTTSPSVLKSHTGATELSQRQEKVGLCGWKVKLCIITVFSLFWSFGINGNLQLKASFWEMTRKNMLQIKKLTCRLSFSELTSHTTKESSSALYPVFCRMSLNPETQKWIG